jgi:membrane protease YdiL (CAAX protease family)
MRMNNMKANVRWSILLLLLLCAVCGVAASFPFVLSLYADKLAEAPLPMPLVLVLGLLQNSIILVVLIGVGLVLTAKTELPGTPLIEDWRAGRDVGQGVRAMISPSLLTGVLVGAVVLLMFAFLLRNELPQLPVGKAALMPVWKRLLLCFYGGLTEEIIMRIFAFSFLIWLLRKLLRTGNEALGSKVFWAANILLALIFGLGHLGSVVPLMPVTFKIVLGALLLNGVASFAFTGLYMRRGLEASMLAHFVADFMIWVIGPSILHR